MEADRSTLVPASPRTAASCGRRSSRAASGSRSGSRSARASRAGSRRRARSSTSPTRTPTSGSSRRSISRAAIARARSSACRCSARSAGWSACCRCSNKQDGPFTHADEELLLALASQAAIAIENARLYHSLVTQNQELQRARRDLERRQRELNALYEVEKELSAALDLDDLLSRILAQAITVLGGGAGLDRARRARRRAAVSHRAGPGGAAADRAHAAARHRAARLVDRAPHAGDRRRSGAGSAARRATSRSETGVTPQHIMVAPLVDGEDVIGGIEIIDQRRAARDGDGRGATTISSCSC